MKLYVVGLGPGAWDQMTKQAVDALEECDVITGYEIYVDLIRERFQHKNLITTPMKKEAERCHIAVKEVLKGQTAAMVCSGDAGVYGMAGLVYEIAQQYDPIEIVVIPGITAACSGAAVLGAPLIHDFVVISLSDLLTPWSLIEKRIACAAMADFVICFYNPSSIKRKDYLKNACEIILNYQKESTMCGFVKNIGRTGETGRILTLDELKDTQVDMFTTVYVGNSKTREIDGKLVTPRGYTIT
ncbi:precorrin-3B C(17)-methyltransferase [Sinanaerobacter chloroacetimidivorans]|jgi:precorrin-3B C17-methyltransferase|uniref:Precorrin-3B C(17)-methyltransferase n=1 Tax=Sinanaerobacter chloroacetimidivorans TaxID=2818044 RepID=A0A8J7VYA7_9FIRM|nr:precorrin-3B C(17)-methyltransferase [Sinanaerobacter chloroacetimidivorans]MBR0597332.1 precorrin-3B C(17)-methyltransferase [Sinanaerobacter chloroacetimidivorans]